MVPAKGDLTVIPEAGIRAVDYDSRSTGYGPKRFLGTLAGIYSTASYYLKRLRIDACFGVSGLGVRPAGVAIAASTQGIPMVLFENGFLPKSIQVDVSGINTWEALDRGARLSSTPTAAWNQTETAFPPRTSRRAGLAEKAGLVLEASRIALGQKQPLFPVVNRWARNKLRRKSRAASNGDYVLLALQLGGDVLLSQMVPAIADNNHIFRLVNQALCNVSTSVELVVRPHPADPHPPTRKGLTRAGALLDNGTPLDQSIAGSLGVITINSAVGFRALKLGKPVICLGDAGYAMPDLVERPRSESELQQSIRRILRGLTPRRNLLSELSRMAMRYFLPDVRDTEEDSSYLVNRVGQILATTRVN
jgi:hypothetical protein